MHNIAKKVVESYLNEQKIPTLEELWVQNNEEVNTKKASFVTLYKDWKIIASSWRINPKKPNTILELIENSLFCLKDKRFVEAIKNPLEIKDVRFRVDLIDSEGRKVLNSINELDISKQWLIFLSQNLWKLSVILPNIANLISTPKDMLDLVCLKAWVEVNNLKEEDYILYSIESVQFNDF